MAGNKQLGHAKATKNDEFYTEYSTISNEVGHYRDQFKGKIVYCNCDDPTWSNFWKYFHSNFASLGLKKLIATHYAKDSQPSYAMIYEGGDDFNMDAGRTVEIIGNDDYTAGDFRSDACLKFLQECDICCTNPPFSLVALFLPMLAASGKNFLVLSPMTALHYKEVFPLIKNNKAWLGYSYPKTFIQPDGSVKKFGNIFWCTNMDTNKRHNGLWHLNGKFDPSQAHQYYHEHESKYGTYYNFDGIDVSSIDDIPIDYEGYMGVPDTIFDKYNPDEIEIVGMSADVPKKYVHKVAEAKTTIQYVKVDTGEVVWETPYTVKERKTGNGLRLQDENGLPGKIPYSRIIIRNRHPLSKELDDDIANGTITYDEAINTERA